MQGRGGATGPRDFPRRDRPPAVRRARPRVDPVAQGGEAKLAGRFPELEAQLAGLVVGGAYQGPGRSPDRADAMVWAMTELLLKPQRAEPRITAL